MKALDKLKEVIFGGNDIKVKPGKPEWTARVRPTIKFASPISRTEFEAKWIGGERSCSKKLGKFTFPRINGTVVQDLSMESDSYPLVFFFDGPKHDLTAKNFWKKTKEIGRWKVWHPIHGLLYLQLEEISQKDAPVDNANITEFSSSWIDPINPETLMTGTDRMGDPDSLDGKAAEEFASSISTKPGALGYLKNAVKAAQGAMDMVFGPVMEVNSIASNAMLVANQTIDSLLVSENMNMLSLAGSIQQTIALPGKIAMDKVALMNSYFDLSEQIYEGYSKDVLIPSPSPGSYNVAKVKSLYAASIMSAAARAILEGGPMSQGTAAALGTLFDYLITQAESDQSIFTDNRRFDTQYFAFQQTYSEARSLGITAFAMALSAEQSGPVSRRYLNVAPSSPFGISAAEYGSSDAGFDSFVELNDLKGIDILLIEPGKRYLVRDNA